MSQQGWGDKGKEWGEEPVDLHRHVKALRRSRFFILLIVIAMTGSAFAFSLSLPKKYTAKARIEMVDSGNLLNSPDATTVARELATAQTLLTTPRILGAAAQRLGVSEKALEGKVQSSVDANANIINVSATSRSSAASAAIANAVAGAFVSQEQSSQKGVITQKKERLLALLAKLRGQPGSASAIQAIQQELTALALQQATSPSAFQVAEAARPPTAPSSPHPVRNAALAFFAAIFLGVLIALGRDQLVPRPSGPGELSRLLDLPVLIKVPYLSRRFRGRPGALSPIEHEAYRTLQTLVAFQLPPTEQRTILVTSAVQGEGKTHAVAALGRTLAQEGYRTLLVSADLRWPKLHEHFNQAASPGLSDVVSAASRNGYESMGEQILAATSAPLVGAHGRGDLRLLSSGVTSSNPGRTLSGDALRAVFDEIDRLNRYDYVLVDGPPLLGHADSHILARKCDAALVVCRLDRLRLETVSDLRETLDRLGVDVLGLIVIGAQAQPSGYDPSEYGPPDEGGAPRLGRFPRRAVSEPAEGEINPR
jgi:capsular exopolysaccharide synthesis family protein